MALPRYLSAICPNFKLDTFAPHSRGAVAKLRRYYTDGSAEMVRRIFAKDFELFGYSRDLDEFDAAPGEMIAAGRLMPPKAEVNELVLRPKLSASKSAFEKALRYRRLIDLHLI